MPGIVARLVGLAVAAVGVLGCASTAWAATLPDATLSSSGQVVTWHGSNPDVTGQGYGPPTEQSCTSSTCDSFVLHVNLPPGTLSKGPLHPSAPGTTRVQAEGPTDMPGDGVLINLRWATDFDQWNLYVDDMSTGQTVAQGIDVDSNSQSVLLSLPHNGAYKVTMVPFYTDFNLADLKYRGEAHVFLDPTQRYPRTTELLPAIQTIAPSNFHIGDVPPITSNPTGWRFTPDGTFSNSCYTDETAEFGSTRCLRFDNDTRNVGSGPLILRFTYDPQAFVGNCDMTQEIIWSNGTASDRNAGPCVFHPQHGHFHYQNFALYQLFGVSPSGQPTAQPVAASHKVGFCTIDVDNYTFGQPASAQRPRTYSFPACNIPNAYSTALATMSPYGPGGVPEFMGISPGWGDVYTWDLPAQYIDISHNVPDGLYEVVSRVNWDGGIQGSDTSKQTGITCIRIAGSTVQTVREFPSQPNTAPLPACVAPRVTPRSAGPTAATLGLPGVGACASRRSFAIRLRHPAGDRLRRATVFVNHRRVRVLRGRRLRARVVLTGLPRGTFGVRVLGVTRSGRRVTDTRTYHTCRKRRRRRGGRR